MAQCVLREEFDGLVAPLRLDAVDDVVPGGVWFGLGGIWMDGGGLVWV